MPVAVTEAIEAHPKEAAEAIVASLFTNVEGTTGNRAKRRLGRPA